MDNRSYTHKRIEKELYSLLEVDSISFIPVLPYDETGHADGMVRLLDDNRVLVNDFSNQSKTWRSKFDKALDSIGREVVQIPYVEPENEKNSYSARGCYINFMQIGSAIIVPIFGLKEDERVIEQLSKLFAHNKVLTIPVNEIAADGGVLNCISWNLYKA
jgi:agmatine deiminase